MAKDMRYSKDKSIFTIRACDDGNDSRSKTKSAQIFERFSE
jgi:hypothetical protein